MIKTVLDPNGNKHKIEIDKDLEWLAPYLSEAKKAGIPVWRLDRIVGYFVPEGKVEVQHAATWKDGHSKAAITLLKKRQTLIGNNDGTIRPNGYTEADKGANFEFTLNSFAHELAHLVIWEHSVERFIVESKLMVRFARLAKRRGYKGYDG